MPVRHIAAALLVVLIWGVNFVVIKVGLREVPPILLAALRFLLAALPAVFFIARPQVPFARIATYGLVMFSLQFALLFGGMFLGMPAGLASLALQVHVFITIALAMAVAGERPSAPQLGGALLAFLGIVVIASRSGGEATALGITLVLLAAAAWAVGNLLSKRIGAVDPLALVVWGSLVAFGPLLLLSLALEGPARVLSSLSQLSLAGLGSIAYLVYPTTLLGFGIWSWLLKRHPAATVAPFTLLVPVVGFTSATLLLGEPLQAWKVLAALLVLAGLAVNLFGARLLSAVRGA
ncbi:MAG TPA: EamA family transporter [Ramlibacter sp.]|nr:EamA family transporter [Ramlibacter sp.]